MIPIRLGRDLESGQPVPFDSNWLQTHLHLIGATGTGKTTALLALLRAIMMEPKENKCCLFLLDPMGNFSHDLLRWMADHDRCPNHVRQRLVYIEPARESFVMPFNPLTFRSEGNKYYRVLRTVDLVLRGWSAQDLQSQPRLLQWTYKAFAAAASMGLPVAFCRHLLHPGTDEHDIILSRIPGHIRHDWEAILKAKGAEATRILESTRNRLDPFFESPILRNMFGVRQSRFDCEQLMRQKKIVIVNLAKLGNLPTVTANTIGALLLNEVFETATRLTTIHGKKVVNPTYIVLDEFQRFVSVDIEEAIPTVRQMGLRLVLAHQSFSQLDREDVDLQQMIWQARCRMAFANNARDADLLADEFAKLTFDPKQIKDIRYTKRQLIVGYRKILLESMNESNSSTVASGSQRTINNGETIGWTEPDDTVGYQYRRGKQQSSGRGESLVNTSGHTTARSRAEAMQPIHDTFDEVSNVTFESFPEYFIRWCQQIRKLNTGEAFLQVPGNSGLRKVKVDRLYIHDSPQIRRNLKQLLQKNFSSEFFVSAQQADQENQQCWEHLLSLPVQTDTLNPPSISTENNNIFPL